MLTIRLPDELFNETKMSSKILQLTPTAYVRNAIIEMNHTVLAQQKKQKLQAASLRVREESMLINQEFTEIEHDIKD